ncbi:MAG: Ig-like domain-containing protein [Tannerella sp.]|jgi:hypothetical protein|nr:Ig-like domain-containing protein [Tannerella sp.]
MNTRKRKSLILNLFAFAVFSLFFLSSCLEERVEFDTPPPTIEMRKGYDHQLTLLSNGVEWTSEDPSVATVSPTGLITALKEGKTVIYTYSSGTKQEVACYVEVYPKRNILLYCATGDKSSIDDDTQPKINAIRKGFDPKTGEMIIYTDRKAGGASLFRINDKKDERGMYGLDTLEIYGNENSAEASRVRRALDYMITRYSADSYGMIFFAHGSGWLPEGTLARPRSLVIDTVGGQYPEMEFFDFANAIPDHSLDYIVFEVCFMADAAVTYALRDKADYMLASSAEILAPGFVPVFEDKIKDLYDTKRPVAEGLQSFGQSYVDYLKATYSETDANCSTTLSLIKLSEMDALASATKTALNGTDIAESNLLIDSIQRFDRPSYLSGQNRSRYFDLGQTIDSLSSQTAAFQAQMDKTVVWKDATKQFIMTFNGFHIRQHSGMTVYIQQERFSYLNSEYRQTDWYRAILP